jgi:hypothetical protein
MRVDTGGGDGEIDTELSPRSSTITDVAPWLIILLLLTL